MVDNSHKRINRWPDYRAVWRWHFYASLFCMPFVIILSITGAIYLFKPQIDRWTDREYDSLMINGSPAPVSGQVAAAVNSLPNSIVTAYELPTHRSNAARVIVERQAVPTRVFVHPVTLEILGSRPDDGGFIRQVRSFHGQLGIGERGSNIVELAASWTIIMILTGLFLWWPRSAKGLGGILYPRLRNGSKIFWRDIHGVTGIWISVFVLFLLLTGLPWAKFWGSYFRNVRAVAGMTISQQDWTLGGVSVGDHAQDHNKRSIARGESGHHSADSMGDRKKRIEMPKDLTCFDRVAATVMPLQLAHPATIVPPSNGSSEWTAKSDAQNRTQRVTLKVNGATGEIVSQEDFSSRPFVDRLVSAGIAAHEGQLFGIANQLLGLFTAMGLILLSVSGYVMWWRRRAPNTLGAPKPLLSPRVSYPLIAIVLLLAIGLPLFGASLLIVLVVEKMVALPTRRAS